MDTQIGNVVGLKHRGRDSTNQSIILEVITDGQSGQRMSNTRGSH